MNEKDRDRLRARRSQLLQVALARVNLAVIMGGAGQWLCVYCGQPYDQESSMAHDGVPVCAVCHAVSGRGHGKKQGG